MFSPRARIANVAHVMSTAVPGHGMNGRMLSSQRYKIGYTTATTSRIATIVMSRRRRSMPANGFGMVGLRARTAVVIYARSDCFSASSPVGRKTRTRMRMPNTMTVVHLASRKRSDSAAISPRTRAPRSLR